MFYPLHWCVRLVVIWILSGGFIVAQINSYGREFWLCFQKNYRQEGGRQNLRLELFITAVADATVRIEIAGLGFRRELQIPARKVVAVSIPPEAEITSSEIKSRKAIHIVSDQPIAVYGLNRRPQSTDTYLGLPLSALGTEYRVIGYSKLSSDFLSQFAVIATEDNTRITITPTAETRKKRPPGIPFTIMLNRGEVYQVIAGYGPRSTSDLTGSAIRSDKPIAVFSGHSCAYVPPLVQACNHLVEQIPPLSKWGKHFYVGKLAKRTRYTIRVVAAYPNTKVFENNRLVATLNAGEFYENSNVRDNVLIAADRPVLVAQYAHGSDDLRDRIGDPMMILITPTQQFLRYYQFATPVRGTWRHYINVVVPRQALASLRLDGKPVDTTRFQRIGVSQYYFAQLQVPYGTHTIKADHPFGMYSYGLGYGSDAYDAYGNVAGQSFAEIPDVRDTLSPLVDYFPDPKGALIVLRDDRNFDWGLLSVSVLEVQGLRFRLPRIVEGVPQVSFQVQPEVEDRYGVAQFEVQDRAGNKTFFTLCYTRDLVADRFTFVVTPGKQEYCPSPSQWEIGGIAGYRYGIGIGEFDRIGNIQPPGYLRGQNHSSWRVGVWLSYRWQYEFGLTLSASLSQPGNVLFAPDTQQSRIRLPDGSFQLMQEATVVTYTGWMASWNASVEWYWNSVFYALLGVQFDFLLSRSARVERQILRPPDYVYATDADRITIFEGSLDALRSTVLSVQTGLGIRIPLWRQWTAVGEFTVLYGLSSAAADVIWKWHGLGIALGVRTPIEF